MAWWYIYQNAKILWTFNNNTTLINVSFSNWKKIIPVHKKGNKQLGAMEEHCMTFRGKGVKSKAVHDALY